MTQVYLPHHCAVSHQQRKPEQKEIHALLSFGTVSFARFLSMGPLKSPHGSGVATACLENSSVPLGLIFLSSLSFFFFPMEWGSQRPLGDGWAMGRCHSGGCQCSEGSGRFVVFAFVSEMPRAQLAQVPVNG